MSLPILARQTRTTGLLRCIGASRRQIMGAVLRTAALTGVAGSVLGAGLGTGAAALLVRSGVVDGLGSQYLTITPASLALLSGRPPWSPSSRPCGPPTAPPASRPWSP